jgi:hypothetical protein
LKHRHDERGCLAGAGFGAADEIVARERQRNERGLDRPRLDEAEIADAFEQARVETERRKRDGRRVARRGFERWSLRTGVDDVDGLYWNSNCLLASEHGR